MSRAASAQRSCLGIVDFDLGLPDSDQYQTTRRRDFRVNEMSIKSNDSMPSLGAGMLERLLRRAIALLPKKPVSFEFELWRRFHKFLPVEMQQRLKQARKGHLLSAQVRPPDAILFAVDGVKGAKARMEEYASGLNDGMRDYPSTRPRLSMDYLAGLIRWLRARTKIV